ncbi:MAG: fimbrillin family protein [Bacteroidia bacterium]|nr:fimbrillin family protein [Bacteroidia bacterium]
MKRIYYYALGAIVASASLNSCSSDDVQALSSTGKVQLNASIQDATTRIESVWTGSEQIGLFMTGESEFAPITGVNNKAYHVATTGAMTPADNQAASYPADGSTVKFVAYYPYSTTINNHNYPIDLADETRVDHDLLYAAPSTTYSKTFTEKVPLAFEHQLSKLTLKVVLDNGSEATGVTASLTRKTQASFNLATGVLSEGSVEKSLAMSVSQAQAMALILPGKGGKVVLSKDNKSYTWDLTNIDFEKGKQYLYTLKLTGKPEAPVEVIGEATIVPWGVGTEGSEDLTEDEPTTAVSYTSNVVLPTQPTSAVQTYAYGGKVKIDETEYSCLKLGSSSSPGVYQTELIGEGKVKLSLHGMAWNNKTGSVKITVNNGGTINGSASVTEPLTPDANMTSTSSPYLFTVNPGQAHLKTFTLEGITAQTTLTFESIKGTDARVLLFGINAE